MSKRAIISTLIVFQHCCNKSTLTTFKKLISGRGGLEVERSLHIQLKAVTYASAGSNLLSGFYQSSSSRKTMSHIHMNAGSFLASRNLLM